MRSGLISVCLVATEGYWRGPRLKVVRYTLRIDGFVSIEAPLEGGEVLTRVLRFKGSDLVINYATSAAGSVLVEIQDPEGKPLPGFALSDCSEIFSDELDRVVRWKEGAGVGRLSGKPIRLHFVMKDADLYSLRFR